MNYLISRYGGIGDVAPVLVVAKQLHKQGHTITLALREDGPVRQTDICKNLKWLKTLDYRQIGPWGTRCVKYDKGWRQIEAVYKDYDDVIDFMYIIEGNSTCKSDFIKRPTDSWKRSRNSNWINWYDNHLMWANIDPHTVPEDEKRPEFKLSKKEVEVGKKLKEGYSKLIVLNPSASSKARSWYQVEKLVPMLYEKYDNLLLALWIPEANTWLFSDKNGPVKKKIPIGSPLRQTMTLIGAADVVLTVDSAVSHISEGLGIKHITLYSTVPWWTRGQYYKHQTAIDPGVEHPEYYTFVLMPGDPLNMEEGERNLTDREKVIKGLYLRKATISEVCKELNTDNHGANLELDCLLKKIESFSRIQSKALSSITPELVLKKVEELCQ
jgi:ADP-heptose:LPS heptosyltransferase